MSDVVFVAVAVLMVVVLVFINVIVDFYYFQYY